MDAKNEPYLLRERSADGVVRCWRESAKEAHSFNREDKPPKVEQRVFVVDGVAKY